LKLNGGTASALNVGIKNMTGEWFKWLSQDDILYSNAIEVLIKGFSEHEKPKNIILYSSFEWIDSNGKLISQHIEPNYNNLSNFDFNIILLDHFVGSAVTSLMHKSTLSNGSLNEEIPLLEDSELWLRYSILHNCRLYLVPKILAQSRIHQTQLTKTKIISIIRTGKKIRKNVLNKLDDESRRKYQKALKKYKKSKPLAHRSKKILGNVIAEYLPPILSSKIIEFYQKSKIN
jgi:glycosyltransferase involved in cell wall biosynthesis